MDVLASDSVATTIESGVRMRSEPGVSGSSELYVPTLPMGAELFVLGGPVRESDYDWYEVQPLRAGLPPRGWVARASKTGQPWIVQATATCPIAPTTVDELAHLTEGMRLACFSQVAIVLSARLLPCECELDPAYDWMPAWLGDNSLALADPARAAPTEPWVFVHLDPTGTYPSPVPTGVVVEVTGMFDHPAARGCTATLASEGEGLRDICRTIFAVTSIR
ncbi:MAG: SH3 domain-containing protein [Candidatus Limnocylindrales bacterium]